MNDQLQWSLVVSKLYGIIRLERNDASLERKCMDKLRKAGAIR